MAINSDELVKMYSARATARLRNMLIWANLTTRAWQGEVQTAKSTRIYTRRDDDDVTIHTTARGADWQTPEDTSLTSVLLEVDQQRDVSSKVEWLDETETPINLVADVADQHAYTMAETVDTQVRGVMMAGVKADNTVTSGTPSTYIDDDGDSTGTNAPKLVYDALDKFALRAKQAKVARTGRMPRMLWAVLSPALVRHLREYLLSKNYADAMNVEMLRDETILMPSTGHVARLFGVDVFESNLAPTATVSGKKHHVIIGGTNEGCALASRPSLSQMISPEVNQTAPEWWIRERRVWGTKVVDDDHLWRFNIRAEA